MTVNPSGSLSGRARFGHVWQEDGRIPGPAASGWLVGRFAGDDGGLVAARDDQAVRGEDFQGVPDHAGTDALHPAGPGD